MAIPRPGGDRTRLTGRLTPPFDRGLSRLLDEWEFDRRCGRCRGVSGPNGTVSPRHRRRPAIHAFCRSAPPEKLVDGRPSPPMIQSFRRARHARGRDLGCRRLGRPQPSGSPSWRYSEPVGGCRKVRLKSSSAGMASWSSPAKQAWRLRHRRQPTSPGLACSRLHMRENAGFPPLSIRRPRVQNTRRTVRSWFAMSANAALRSSGFWLLRKTYEPSGLLSSLEHARSAVPNSPDT